LFNSFYFYGGYIMKKTTLSLLTALVLSTGTMCSAMHDATGKDAKQEVKVAAMDPHAQTSGQPVRVLPVSTSDTSGSLSSLASSSATGLSSEAATSTMATSASQLAELQLQMQVLRQQMQLQQMTQELAARTAPQQPILIPQQPLAPVVVNPQLTLQPNTQQLMAAAKEASEQNDALKNGKAAQMALLKQVLDEAPDQTFRSYRSPYDLVKMTLDWLPGKNSTDFGNNVAYIVTEDGNAQSSTLKIPVLNLGESKTFAVCAINNDTATNTQQKEWYLVTFEAQQKGWRNCLPTIGRFFKPLNRSEGIDTRLCPISRPRNRADFTITKLPPLDPGYKKNYVVVLEDGTSQVTYQIKIHRSVEPTAFRTWCGDALSVMSRGTSGVWTLLTLPQTVPTYVLEKFFLLPGMRIGMGKFHSAMSTINLTNEITLPAINPADIKLSAADQKLAQAAQTAKHAQLVAEATQARAQKIEAACQANGAHLLATTLVSAYYITVLAGLTGGVGVLVGGKLSPTLIASWKAMANIMFYTNITDLICRFVKEHPKLSVAFAAILIAYFGLAYGMGAIQKAALEELPAWLWKSAEAVSNKFTQVAQCFGLSSPAAATTAATTATETSVQTLTAATAKQLAGTLEKFAKHCCTGLGKGTAQCAGFSCP
jgi:hypothetical protein